ncbi:unnamed protein product [Euphydryas editha]|uniref:Uncharacterized protein n=1 Tax=Euphydryas editha TaxID=104508 RepID=A0AAU9THX9_EUPED|nr:unnamed protein product [Euphydryas editha]
MRTFLRRLVEGNLQITPRFTVPKTRDFAKSENDLTKYRLREGRPGASRRAMSIEFKSYANVMDNKKVNVNDKCRLRGAIVAASQKYTNIAIFVRTHNGIMLPSLRASIDPAASYIPNL